MSDKIAIGKNTLGSGDKMNIEARHYERSTHDIGYVWKSSMSSGTLVPAMFEIGLAGTDMEVKMKAMIMTHPTIGPLFGSYKFQIDLFQADLRLYNGKMWMDEVGTGMNIETVKLPQIEISANDLDYTKPLEGQQINTSSVLAYCDIRGLGHRYNLVQEPTEGAELRRKFAVVKLLMYHEIGKNYYANKQEELGMVIHNPLQPNNYESVDDAKITTFFNSNGSIPISAPNLTESENPVQTGTLIVSPIGGIYLSFTEPLTGDFKINPETVLLEWNGEMVKITDIFDFIETDFDGTNGHLTAKSPKPPYASSSPIEYGAVWISTAVTDLLDTEPQISTFALENVDKMRKQIMRAVDEPGAFTLDRFWANDLVNGLSPYKYLFHRVPDTDDPTRSVYSIMSSQEGLLLKTYQNDVMNNWLNTEWIDGDNGVNELSKIRVDASGEFTIDQMQMKTKIWKMMNAIAVGDGSIRAWRKANYDHDATRQVTGPIYVGSLIKEIVFDEVVSNSATPEQPLGTLAGRGHFNAKDKGGYAKIRFNEEGYLIAIASITPRLDYSQGNKWDNLIENYQQLHTPAMDQIGFEDLITDRMAYWDTGIDQGTDPMIVIYKSAGKQPAWINYTTNVNRVYGSFAEENNEMFMVLNRRYEAKQVVANRAEIKDLTTYIDPTKFNNIFAYTKLDAQNFWVQIGFDIEKRAKMSARLMPSL